MSAALPRTRVVVLLLALGATVSMLAAARAGAALPELSSTISSGGSFTLTYNGAPVAGTTIPPGTYDISIDNTVDASILFQVSGPGVNLSSTVGAGEPDVETDQLTFAPSSSYTVQNANLAGSAISFSTSATVSSSSSGSGSSSSSGSSTSGGGSSILGGATTTAAPTTNPLLGTLSGSVSSKGVLTLTLKGKTVATLPAGRYTVSVNDKSKTAGFILEGPHSTTVTLTTASFKGTHSETVTFTQGQWLFAPSSHGLKTYFVVVS